MSRKESSGKPIMCIVTIQGEGVKKKAIRSLFRQHHSLKGEGEGGNELHVKVARKHQTLINKTLKGVSGLKIMRVKELPTVEPERIVTQPSVVMERKFSEKQKTLKKREVGLRWALDEALLMGMPLREIREYAACSTKAEFLELHKLTLREFNDGVIKLTDELSKEFDREINLGVCFTYPILLGADSTDNVKRVTLSEHRLISLKRAREARKRKH